MAQVYEYKCGCMVHSLAGAIRFCRGLISTTLGGRRVTPEEGAASKHADAMKAAPAQVFEVADLVR